MQNCGKENTLMNVTYNFSRENSPAGFLSQNSASTDALNALGEWADGEDAWDFVIDEDAEDFLTATLSFEDEHLNRVGRRLDLACANHGVVRVVVLEG